jgi:hypothetical protein
MHKKLLATLGLALGASLTTLPATAALITFVPAEDHIDIGETVDVAVNISGLGDEILSAFDLDLFFDEAIIDNIVVTHNAVSQFGGLANSLFDTNFFAGRTENIDASLLFDEELAATQANAFTILTFTFRGVANGFSTLAFGPDLFFERNFTGLNAESLVMDIGTACISVGTGTCQVQVPEPATISLLGIGLLGALALRRRRRDGALV